MTGDPKDVWRDQPTETPPMTLAQIHARGFQDRIKRRNMIEYVACAIVVAVFSAYVFVLPDPVLRLASGLTAVGTLVVAYQLHRRASARPAPSADALGFHRAELLRQHEALSKAWLWYLAPVAPGLGLFLGRILTGHPEAPLQGKLLLVGSCLLYGGAWFWMNRRALGRLKVAIAEIDALRRG